MDAQTPYLNCMTCKLNRRNFLAAGCAVGAGALTKPQYANSAETAKTKIHIVYSLHDTVQPGPDWPNVGFDFAPFMERTNKELAARCPEMDFTASMAKGEEEAKAILERDKDKQVDGYLVFQLNCWNKVVQTIAKTSKPVLYADFQYGGSGGFLVYTAGFLRKNTSNLGFVASSNMDDLIAAVKQFAIVQRGGSPSDFAQAVERIRKNNTPKTGDMTCLDDPVKTIGSSECMKRLRESRILAVKDQNARAADDLFGIPVEYIPFAEINDAWKRADKDQSKEIANRWANNASEVIDVSQETLETSAAMYLGMKEVMKKHDANAITVNCLGDFYGGHIHAYPCLGFHELNNEALIGACECDLQSTASMLAVTTLTQGRPGYISDPVIDTAKRQIIYAHCVAPNKMFGPDGKTNPFSIMTHSEDRQGASLRSVMPLGYMTTTIKVKQQTKQFIFHQGKAVDNDPDDRACRTKLGVEPIGDIEKLFSQWDQWGWHRVT
ncbi:hypothetical protein K8I31_01005, partial [bacterium]|nr:hypothetical protein [bacterium]